MVWKKVRLGVLQGKTVIDNQSITVFIFIFAQHLHNMQIISFNFNRFQKLGIIQPKLISFYTHHYSV